MVLGVFTPFPHGPLHGDAKYTLVRASFNPLDGRVSCFILSTADETLHGTHTSLTHTHFFQRPWTGASASSCPSQRRRTVGCSCCRTRSMPTFRRSPGSTRRPTGQYPSLILLKCCFYCVPHMFLRTSQCGHCEQTVCAGSIHCRKS